MSRTNFWLSLSMLCLLIGAVGPHALAEAGKQPSEAEKLWVDFNYYVRVAKPQLAKDTWTKLAAMVSEEQLLDIAEGNDEYKFSELNTTLDFLTGNETLKPVGIQLRKMIDEALTARSREPKRISEAIEKLDDGARPNFNARKFLRSSGQFAVPYLLDTLLNDRQKHLHPYVLRALVDIGRDAVYPLSVAVVDLEPVQQRQVATVLVEIGYPTALPYLKQIVESKKTDPSVVRQVSNAYEALLKASKSPSTASAAELFYTQGEAFYRSGTLGRDVPGYDEKKGNGIIWSYYKDSGLAPTVVPGSIHADVRAMRAAQRALQLDESMAQALSLFLAANARREIRLPEGERDRSYRLKNSPIFYMQMAGALRQHDVLARALEDDDIALARVAIAALGHTGGIDELVNAGGELQPLRAAMNHPNRLVRFDAIRAVAASRPSKEFSGSNRVVPVLAESIRQTGKRYAMVIAADQASLNRLSAAVDQNGYIVAYRGLDFAGSTDARRSAPAIDVIIVEGSGKTASEVFQKSLEDYRLAATPVIAAVSSSDARSLQTRHLDKDSKPDPRLITVIKSADANAIANALKSAEQYGESGSLTQEQADEYARSALTLLREIAMTKNEVLDVTIAQPALVQALNDSREFVVTGAASVLALIDDSEAQQSIAEAAFDAQRSASVRVALLGSLAESANYHGSKLTKGQLQSLLRLTQSVTGEIAEAASRAGGAHLPDTEMVTVEMLRAQ